VTIIFSTGGNKGWGKDYNMTSAKLGPIRENEQLQAASLMGIKNTTFLRNDDGSLEGVDPLKLKYNLTYWVRTYKPDLVLSFSPETEYSQYSYGVMHRDHQTTGIFVFFNVILAQEAIWILNGKLNLFKQGKSTIDTLWPVCRDYLAYPDLFDNGTYPWDVPEFWMFSFKLKQNDDEVLVKLSNWMFNSKYQVTEAVDLMFMTMAI